MIDRKYLIGIVFLGVVILLNLPVRTSKSLEAGARDNLAPFENVLSVLVSKLADGLAFLARAGRVHDEKRSMQEEIAGLKLEVARLGSLEQENDELRRQVGFLKAQKFRLVMCEVIARGDASGWWQTITLNKGSDNGIEMNRAVVTSEGLIGRTSVVSKHSCDVLLITDPSCKVACKAPRTGAFGIVRGMGVSIAGSTKIEMLCAAKPCRIDYVPKDDKISEGDEVVASGLGGTFPEGVLLGRISEAGIDQSGLYQRADVVPAADMLRLKYVFVVLAEKGKRVERRARSVSPGRANGTKRDYDGDLELHSEPR